MDAVLVRPLSPGDQSAVTALFASAGRRPVSVATPHDSCVAMVAGPPERVIGFAAWWRVRLDKFRMDLLVAPHSRRRGVGTQLLSHLVRQARVAGALTMQARVESDDQESLEFLAARGFVETMRMHRQVLHVAGAKPTLHAHVMARLAERGIVIASLDPDPGPVTPLTPSELLRRHQAAAEEHGVGAEQCFVAVRGNRYVGFTGALGTAVDPAFRGQEIATALKRRAVIS